MAHRLVVNRNNNLGDAMCQMRGLYEYKQRTNDTLDFITCHYLHYVAACHTDIFGRITFGTIDEVNSFAAGAQSNGYDSVIEFTVDWGIACRDGILRAWVENTLHFTPSTDKPYFLLTAEEKIVAKSQYGMIMEKGFRKSIILNLESVSAYTRGFRLEDWQRVIEMIPNDVAIIYPVPISWTWGNPFPPKSNLFVIPGYPIGYAGALSQLVDTVLVVHSGPLMLAYACDAKNIVQINFNEGGSPALLRIPEGQGENFYIETNREIPWLALQDLINRHLA